MQLYMRFFFNLRGIQGMNKQYLFDLHHISQEIYGYMKTYLLEANFLHDPIVFVRDLEQLLYQDAQLVIETNVHPLIRKEHTDTDIYRAFSYRYNFDQIILENTIDSMISYRYVTSKINELMGQNTFNVWALTRYAGGYRFESMGDFRINFFNKNYVRVVNSGLEPNIDTVAAKQIEEADHFNDMILADIQSLPMRRLYQMPRNVQLVSVPPVSYMKNSHEKAIEIREAIKRRKRDNIHDD